MQTRPRMSTMAVMMVLRIRSCFARMTKYLLYWSAHFFWPRHWIRVMIMTMPNMTRACAEA